MGLESACLGLSLALHFQLGTLRQETQPRGGLASSDLLNGNDNSTHPPRLVPRVLELTVTMK